MIVRAGLAVSTAITLSCFAVPALANTDGDRESVAGEIIVTANKRDESISKVGASIAAFDTTMLENRNIGTPEELVQNVHHHRDLAIAVRARDDELAR